MSSIKVDVKGQNELNRLARNAANLDAKGKVGSRAIKELSLLAESGIKQGITAFGAIDTGFLRSSVRIIEFQPPFRAVIGPTAPYAFWVHEGTSRMRSRSFIPLGWRIVERDVKKVLIETGFKLGVELVKGL